MKNEDDKAKTKGKQIHKRKKSSLKEPHIPEKGAATPAPLEAPLSESTARGLPANLTGPLAVTGDTHRSPKEGAHSISPIAAAGSSPTAPALSSPLSPDSPGSVSPKADEAAGTTPAAVGDVESSSFSALSSPVLRPASASQKSDEKGIGNAAPPMDPPTEGQRRKSSVRFGPAIIREITEMHLTTKIEENMRGHALPFAIAISFAVIVCGVMVFLIVLFPGRDRDFEPCVSHVCRSALNYLDSVSNKDVNPCDDFYTNVCFKWTRSSSTFLEDVVDQFYNSFHTSMMLEGSELPSRYGEHIMKSTYRACYHFVTKQGDSMRRILKLVEFDRNKMSDMKQLLIWLAKLSLEKGLESIFRFTVAKWETKAVFWHLIRGRSLMQRFGENSADGNFALYISELTRSMNISSELVDEIVKLDYEIYNGTMEDEDEQPVGRPVSELARLSSHVSLKDWLQTLNAVQRTSALNSNGMFLATGFDATVKAIDAIATGREVVRAPYIYIQVAAELLRFDYQRRFKNYTGVPMFCLGASMKLLTHTWSFLVTRFVTQPRKDREMKDVFNSVLDVSIERNRTAWLDRKTRDHITAVLEDVAVMNFSVVEAEMNGVDYSNRGMSADFLAAYLQLLEHEASLLIEVPLRRDVEIINEIQYNGIIRYVGKSPVIVVPTASTSAPLLYGGTIPHYFNFGTVGTLLAKELSRKIRPFSNGRASPLWSPGGITAVKPTLRCLQKQVGINGTRSDDYEGLFEWSRSVWVAYDAMLRDIQKRIEGVQNVHLHLEEAKKTFFRRFCLVSCGKDSRSSSGLDSNVRCNMPLQNMPEFATTFGCVRGDYMAPATRCYVL
ncbi:uncharacterized protein LOC135397647 isoform X2 [Ornithodoros turicata]|uniref:uncharacterized protein LOC135397647 isoform X2 n=1 Tax=Ornithodoros turicata TaxID=34597 RepID=UPI0031393C64